MILLQINVEHIFQGCTDVCGRDTYLLMTIQMSLMSHTVLLLWQTMVDVMTFNQFDFQL